jgi:hypothetical protein
VLSAFPPLRPCSLLHAEAGKTRHRCLEASAGEVHTEVRAASSTLKTGLDACNHGLPTRGDGDGRQRRYVLAALFTQRLQLTPALPSIPRGAQDGMPRLLASLGCVHVCLGRQADQFSSQLPAGGNRTPQPRTLLPFPCFTLAVLNTGSWDTARLSCKRTRGFVQHLSDGVGGCGDRFFLPAPDDPTLHAFRRTADGQLAAFSGTCKAEAPVSKFGDLLYLENTPEWCRVGKGDPVQRRRTL